MKKSTQEIVWRTCGRGTANGGNNYLDGEEGNDILNNGGPGSELYGGACNNGRIRRRTHAAIVNSDKAANNAATHAWRIAA